MINRRSIRTQFPRLRTAIAIALLLLATPLVAQSGAKPAVASDTSALGPPAAASGRAPVAVDRASPSSAAPSWTTAPPVASTRDSRAVSVDAVRAGSTWENTTLMIVGGTGMLAGAVIGGRTGTLVSIGGTVAGLIGFLNYVR